MATDKYYPIEPQTLTDIIVSILSGKYFDEKAVCMSDFAHILSSKYQIDYFSDTFNYHKKDKTVYYDKILLFGDRFQYVNQLLKLEPNKCIRDDIFNHIKKLDYKFFEELNEESSSDSFIQCLDSVFNSDTYFEMMIKLDFLVDASQMRTKTIVEDLKSDRFKEKRKGVIFSYPNPNEVQNLVAKPLLMTERTYVLYSRNPETEDYTKAFLDYYPNATSIEDLYFHINDKITEENKELDTSPTVETKKKQKRFLSFLGREKIKNN